MPKTRKYAVPGGGTRWMRGGYLKEVPKPYKRWYNGRRKREVKVSVYGYWGVGIHYYVSVNEDDNAIWNSKEKLWQLCWDDKDRGKKFDKKFGNIVLAQEWVKMLQKKHFPKKTHKMSQDWDNLHIKEDKRVWLGIFKQGD